MPQLGVLRIRGNKCRYSQRAPKHLRGKLTTCRGKKITGSASKAFHCETRGKGKRCKRTCYRGGKKAFTTRCKRS